tara:strand:+ start:1093 stop:1200 length:108 start_codon:yes stop_codon:yes gene_type:complete
MSALILVIKDEIVNENVEGGVEKEDRIPDITLRCR